MFKGEEGARDGLLKGAPAAAYDPEMVTMAEGKRESSHWGLIISMFFGCFLLRQFSGPLGQTASSYMYRDLHTPAPHMEILAGLGFLPFACKPMIGLLSDCYAPFGYHKMPMMILFSVLGCLGYCALCLLPTGAVSADGIALLLLWPGFQQSVCDLMLEGEYAARIRKDPHFGATFAMLWPAFQMTGPGLARALYGPLSNNGARDGRIGMLVCAFCSLPVLVPTVLNLHGEQRSAAKTMTAIRAKLSANKNYVILSVAITTLAVASAVINMLVKTASVKLPVTLLLFCLMLIALHVWARPEMARSATYCCLLVAASVDISGAAFNFYIDTPLQYRAGPHFSVMFFNTALPLAVFVFQLAALAFYRRFLVTWRFRTIFLLPSMCSAMSAAASLMVFTRKSVTWGIPDEFLAFWADAWSSFCATCFMIPIINLIAKSSPEGLEAWSWGIFAGVLNQSGAVCRYFGAELLASLHIAPAALPGEDAQFDNMWMLPLLLVLLQMLPLPLLPVLIPDIRQTDALPTTSAQSKSDAMFEVKD